MENLSPKTVYENLNDLEKVDVATSAFDPVPRARMIVTALSA